MINPPTPAPANPYASKPSSTPAAPANPYSSSTPAPSNPCASKPSATPAPANPYAISASKPAVNPPAQAQSQSLTPPPPPPPLPPSDPYNTTATSSSSSSSTFKPPEHQAPPNDPFGDDDMFAELPDPSSSSTTTTTAQSSAQVVVVDPPVFLKPPDPDPFGDDDMFAELDDPSTSTSATKQEEYDTSPPPTQTPKPSSLSTSTSHQSYHNNPIFSKTPLSPTSTSPTLTATLTKYFGYTSFRPYQSSIISKLLAEDKPDDVLTLWSTGSGKSLLYQIPALHLYDVSKMGRGGQKVVIVISPLISLMQDQCHKLNSLGFGKLATFLGSGQMEVGEEEKAFRGVYPLVYMTPEKLGTEDTLKRLKGLEVMLLAVDEAHCLSSWGHDFRPSYKDLRLFRQHPSLSRVPIIALTGTALPSVCVDICTTLGLHRPILSLTTFDRTNLMLSCKKKASVGGPAETLRSFITSMKRCDDPNLEATIVYCATRSEVDSIHSMLASAFSQQKNQPTNPKITVEKYHAGMSPTDRTYAHTSFLTSTSQVIVATVAFGMGIDKPDTRRIIHYGPPKSMEDYYQQVGRAGRDGLVSECIMYASFPGDFDRYNSDFYIKPELSQEQKNAQLSSLYALRSYASNGDECRRKAILNFFNESPAPFGTRCKTCDNCIAFKLHGNGANGNTRDFSSSCLVPLVAVQALYKASLSTILAVVSGKTVEDWRYAYDSTFGARSGMIANEVQAKIKNLIAKSVSIDKKKHTQDYYKDLILQLEQTGYLSSGTGKGKFSSFTNYSITVKGVSAIRNPSMKIMLPIPQSIRDREEAEEVKVRAREKELVDAGVDVKAIPVSELENGAGEVYNAYSFWTRTLNALLTVDEDEDEDDCGKKLQRHRQLVDLKSRITEWRTNTARSLQIAPVSVCPDHLILAVAYAASRGALSVEGLAGLGIRGTTLEGLSEVTRRWNKETGNDKSATSMLSSSSSSSSSSGGKGVKRNTPKTKSNKMTFKPGNNKFKTQHPWLIEKPLPKTGKLPNWLISYNRFTNDDVHVETIAMTQASGKPILPSTVVGHLIDAIGYGRAVDVGKLVSQAGAGFGVPDLGEWSMLADACVAANVEVGISKGVSEQVLPIIVNDVLRPILGEEVVNTPYNERTKDMSNVIGYWSCRFKWFLVLKRGGFPVEFEKNGEGGGDGGGDGKKMKVGGD